MQRITRLGATFSLVAVSLFLLNGCALIFQGTSKNMSFDSGPGSAEVWVNGAKAGVTPCKIELKRNQEYTIEFKKDGFQTKTYRITNGVGGGWVVLDILGGLIPVIIDAATGAWYGFDQDNVNAVLEKQQ